MKSGKFVIFYIVLIGLLAANMPLWAQGGPPSGPPSSGGPIDGGAFTLLFGAAAYGYRKLKNKERKRNE